MPTVCVLTTVWNQIEKTIACLETVAAQDYAQFQTVVVNNASTDNSSEIIRKLFPSITLIENEQNLGFSGGYNVGLRYVLAQQFDYVFLINNDTLLAPDCITQLVETFKQHANAGFLTAKIYYAEAPQTVWTVGAQTHPQLLEIRGDANGQIDNGQWERVRQIAFAPLCGVLLSKQVLEKVGILDERYFLYYEDMDYCQRIREADFKLYLAPAAKMWHAVSASSGGSYRAGERYFMAQSSGRYFRTNATRSQLLLIVPYRLASALRTTGRLLMQRKIKAVFSYWLGLSRGWISTDATRKPPRWLLS